MNPILSLKRRHALQAIAVLATATALPVTAHTQDRSVWLVVTHKVEDFGRWKPVFDSTAALKRSHGWKQSQVFAIDDDPNNLMVMEAFDSMEHAKAYASSPELKSAMGKAGVIGAPEIRFVNQVAYSKA